MEHTREMTNEVDSALKRVRGELVTLEQALRVLKDSINERSVAVGSGNVSLQSIRNVAEKATEVPRWNDIDRVLSNELCLPEYGALRAPDDEMGSDDHAAEKAFQAPTCWNDLSQVLKRELWLPEFGPLLPSDDQV